VEHYTTIPDSPEASRERAPLVFSITFFWRSLQPGRCGDSIVYAFVWSQLPTSSDPFSFGLTRDRF